MPEPCVYPLQVILPSKAAPVDDDQRQKAVKVNNSDDNAGTRLATNMNNLLTLSDKTSEFLLHVEPLSQFV